MECIKNNIVDLITILKKCFRGLLTKYIPFKCLIQTQNSKVPNNGLCMVTLKSWDKIS